MAEPNTETHTRQAICPTHGQVTAENEVPRLRFPFLVWFAARRLSARKPYHCPACGAEAS